MNTKQTYKNKFGDFGYHFIVMDQISPDWVTEHLVHRQVLQHNILQPASRAPRVETVIRDELFRDLSQI